MDIVVALAPSVLLLTAYYALIGLAWVLIFRATDVLNVATGSFLVLGGYFLLWLRQDVGLPFAAAAVMALVMSGGLGATIYQVVLKPMAGLPHLAPVITTIGIAIVLEGSAWMVWGRGSHAVDHDVTGTFVIGDFRISRLSAIVILAAVAFTGLLLALDRWSRIGIQMRAASENWLRAGQLGVRVHMSATVAWTAAAVAAAGAGVGFGATNIVGPEAASLGLRGLAPALLGGLESPGGAVIGAAAIATLEVTAVHHFGGTVRQPIAFAAILLVLIVRPHGLFGKPTSMRV